ncbi:hypothetical protein CHGG_01541 [Chaetomium globosum CBS 148.51]|uniref:Oxysterol-binding protein n=1 Tax=Chaetomium globosum (strain ATCC 6205 / CBS 148.51 / DSM 1962 / NBRC 6347 / NRRL 1970) TaxID=306901 RepID=Q2HE13_CHAGB|nr:uncharacterized protein CHGG_01541 [Chaetomium globosum CBS 148.51]EAQ93306.1 hypothetical protein CHGG_01541 [Chaetomium globosum CBS 148.51]
MTTISKLRDFLKARHDIIHYLRPSLFAAPALEPDPELRALLVLKWILTSLKHQLYVDGAPGRSIKKPLNAFLGEIFRAQWTDGRATANLVSEQVSHHPPITAVYMWDAEHGIHGEGYSRVEMTYSGGVSIRQTGHAMLHIDKYSEEHLIFLPHCSVKGFMSGSMFPELNGTYHIVSSSGFVSEIVFSGTSLLGTGQRNAVKATMYRRDDPAKTPLYTISVTNLLQDPVLLGGAGPLRVEAAWQGVMAALRRGDFGDAVTEKSKVEKAQRLMRAAEKESGNTKWEPLLFAPLSRRYEEFERLGPAVGWQTYADETKGVWKVNREKAEGLKRPFRPGLTPLGREDVKETSG